MKRLTDFLWSLLAIALADSLLRNRLVRRAEKTPYFHIYGPDGLIYIERFWLFNPVDRDTNVARYRWCPFSVRLHRIHREDTDRHPHDHPWNARSIILSGGYIELRRDRAMLRTAGMTYSLCHGEYHRIAQVCEGGATTLFVTGRRQGEWGFWVDGQKVLNQQYLSGENK